MNVIELIGYLMAVASKHTDAANYEVTTEGCDCDGDVAGVEIDTDHRSVYLRRTTR